MLQSVLSCDLVLYFSLSPLSSPHYHRSPLFCRYNKHVAFHAMQISRLSALSLKNLATCVAKRELPADFPPKEPATSLFNYADGSKTVCNPVIVTVTPTAVTYARSHSVGDEQQLVTVSNRAKRPLAELQVHVEGGDSPAFVCEFTPTRKVREMAAAVCVRSI